MKQHQAMKQRAERILASAVAEAGLASSASEQVEIANVDDPTPQLNLSVAVADFRKSAMSPDEMRAVYRGAGMTEVYDISTGGDEMPVGSAEIDGVRVEMHAGPFDRPSLVTSVDECLTIEDGGPSDAEIAARARGMLAVLRSVRKSVNGA